MKSTVKKIFIDSDNGLGKGFGDIDDAFAISSILRSQWQTIALASVFGNVSERNAFYNHQMLCQQLKKQIPILHGATKPMQNSDASEFLQNIPEKFSVLAIGPLTNIAVALKAKASLAEKVEEIIFVGSNYNSKGKYPPFWPYEFNLRKDKLATQIIFASQIPLKIVPLDQAKKMLVKKKEIGTLPGGEFFLRHSHSWFLRSLLLKAKTKVPIWDLVASFALIKPEYFQFRKTTAYMRKNTHISFHQGNRNVEVLESFNAEKIWEDFHKLLNPNSKNSTD